MLRVVDLTACKRENGVIFEADQVLLHLSDGFILSCWLESNEQRCMHSSFE